MSSFIPENKPILNIHKSKLVGCIDFAELLGKIKGGATLQEGTWKYCAVDGFKKLKKD